MDDVSLFRTSHKRKRQPEATEHELEDSVEQSTQSAPSVANSIHTASAPITNFQAFGLSKWLVSAVNSMGIRVPTPVQAACIPAALARQDVIGCAQTGSGKTAAFALPVLQALGDDPYGIFAVILTPSRELAFQISEQFAAFGAPLGVRVATITGGMDMVKQGLELAASPHIVVATPGRLAHHLNLGTSPPDLSRAPWLVLDECDRLADPYMAADIKVVLDACTHPQRRNLLFSATVPPSLRAGQTGIAGLVLNGSPFVFDANDKTRASASSAAGDARTRSGAAEEAHSSDAEDDSGPAAAHEVLAPVTAPNLTQQYLFMPSAVKNAYLFHTLQRLGPADLVVTVPGQEQGSGGASNKGGKGKRPSVVQATSGKEAFSSAVVAEAEGDGWGADLERARSIIIFVSTCYNCAVITELLRELGIPCVSLHSVMTQQDRLSSLAKFKSSIVRVLVATDVASRGLDIPTVDLVLNYDVPRVASDYVHRVGRTARAGRPGRAVTMITQYDVDLVHAVEERVLAGKQLAALPAAFVIEDRHILPKLGAIAASLHLARTKLKDNGMSDKLAVYSQRKQEAREKRQEAAAR